MKTQPSPAFCTVITNRYVSHGRVLARRLAECHEGATLYAFLADEDDGCFDAEAEPFVLVRPSDLVEAGAIDPFVFRDMAFYYGAFELCNGIRPYLHRFMRAVCGRDRWFYLDSDIWVIHSLEPLFEELAQTSILLSPHCLAPPTGRVRLQTLFLRYGVFNSGCLGIRRSDEADRFLDWWCDAMRFCAVTKAPYQGDQPWLNAVPAYFPGSRICRNPGANVGYWNIHERKIEKTTDGFLCNRKPWLFAHLSGLELGNYDRLSNWAREYDGRVPAAWKEVHWAYHEALLDDGLEETASLPYAFDHFSDGTRITPRVRNLYREDCLQGNNLVGKSPFDCSREFRRRALGDAISDVVAVQMEAGKYFFAPQTRPIDLKKIA